MKKGHRKPARGSQPAPRLPAASAASASASFSKALALHQQGQVGQAEAGYRAVLALDSGHPDANNNLAVILRKRHRHEEAHGCYERALAQAPERAALHGNFGCLLLDMARADDAGKRFRAALVLQPDFAEAYSNLADAFSQKGNQAAALASYAIALRLKPDLINALNNMGAILKGQGELERAVGCFMAALRVRSDLAAAYCNLGETLKDQGRIADAVVILQKGLAINPDSIPMHSNVLFALNYMPDVTVDTVFRIHRHWAVQHADPLLPQGKRHANDRSPGRRLRIGYLSPDFATHSVSFFAEPLIREHDRSAVEVFCYAEEVSVDITTERLRKLADHWRPIRGLTDDEAAARIEADGIDILVDLAGHTANNRLLVLARKPAPVQVTWLGYPNTTGMRAIDYRLTDGIAEPEAGPHTPGSETPVRLPHGFHAYEPPFFAPPCDPLPALRNGHITFGSFNNLSKVTPEVVRLWAEILRRVPDARLLLKAKALGDAATRDRYRALFAQQGVASERLDLLARIEPGQDHLRAYGRLDIALDPFPYNGTTTTCEALWMGVPVVTLAGSTHVGRVGASLLTNAGLPDLIATDEAAYVGKAVALAGDREALARMRDGMRDHLRRMPLTDYTGFTRAVEAAYRAMWRAWLEQAGAR